MSGVDYVHAIRKQADSQSFGHGHTLVLLKPIVALDDNLGYSLVSTVLSRLFLEGAAPPCSANIPLISVSQAAALQ